MNVTTVTTVTVYGVDIDTLSEVDCMPILYPLADNVNSGYCYKLLAETLKAFKVYESVAIADTAIAAIFRQEFHLQIQLEGGDTVALTVPLRHTQLVMDEFKLMTIQKGSITFPAAAQVEVADVLRARVQDEYQLYLNGMMKLKVERDAA